MLNKRVGNNLLVTTNMIYMDDKQSQINTNQTEINILMLNLIP
jgi:hypothetical protein